jgi:hypothetical protein
MLCWSAAVYTGALLYYPTTYVYDRQMFSTDMVWLLSLELCIACAAAVTTAGGSPDRSPITRISALHLGTSSSCQQQHKQLE